MLLRAGTLSAGNMITAVMWPSLLDKTACRRRASGMTPMWGYLTKSPFPYLQRCVFIPESAQRPFLGYLIHVTGHFASEQSFLPEAVFAPKHAARSVPCSECSWGCPGPLPCARQVRHSTHASVLILTIAFRGPLGPWSPESPSQSLSSAASGNREGCHPEAPTASSAVLGVKRGPPVLRNRKKLLANNGK